MNVIAYVYCVGVRVGWGGRHPPAEQSRDAAGHGSAGRAAAGEGARAGSELRGVLPLSDDHTNYQSKDRFCAIGLSST